MWQKERTHTNTKRQKMKDKKKKEPRRVFIPKEVRYGIKAEIDLTAALFAFLFYQRVR